MRKILLILSCSIFISGCLTKKPNHTILEGDLYYTWLGLGSFYKQPDSLYKNYIHLRDSIGIAGLRKTDYSIFIDKIELLEKHGLEQSPFIYLKNDLDTKFIVYMSPEDYKPITKHSYQLLKNNHQKVRLKLVTEKLKDNLVLCKEVISIQKIDGETLQRRKKFKLTDYR